MGTDSTAEAMAGTEARRPRGGIWSALAQYVGVPIVIAALMAYYLLASRRVVGDFGFPLDDSWIHVRFAQNLARGNGFSFNPGQPASTTTGPLWTLLLALGYRLTPEYVFTAGALNWVLCCLTAFTAGSLAQTLIPDRRFGAAVALAVAVTVPLPWLALSGMEPPLFMWLTLLGILLHTRLRGSRAATALAPTLIFAPAVYARPELLLLFPLAMLDQLLIAKRQAAGSRWAGAWLKQLALHTPVYLLLIAPLFIYNYRVTGRPMPSSYYIKAMNFGFTMALATRDNGLLMQSLVLAPIKYAAMLVWMLALNNLALLAPFFLGFVEIVRRARRSEAVSHGSLLIPMMLVVQPVAWAISTNAHREPWFQGERYVANLGPLYVIVGMAGLYWLLERRHRASGRALIGTLALVLAASLARQPDQARLYAHNVKNINEMQVATARWLAQHVPKDSLLAVNDVGAIGVIADMKVLDMIGLVSPEILRHLTLANARTGIWRQLIWEEADRKRPDYLVVVMRPERYEGFVRAGNKPIFKIEIKDNITCGGPLIVVFESKWRLGRTAPPSAPPSGDVP